MIQNCLFIGVCVFHDSLKVTDSDTWQIAILVYYMYQTKKENGKTKQSSPKSMKAVQRTRQAPWCEGFVEKVSFIWSEEENGRSNGWWS